MSVEPRSCLLQSSVALHLAPSWGLKILSTWPQYKKGGNFYQHLNIFSALYLKILGSVRWNRVLKSSHNWSMLWKMSDRLWRPFPVELLWLEICATNESGPRGQLKISKNPFFGSCVGSRILKISGNVQQKLGFQMISNSNSKCGWFHYASRPFSYLSYPFSPFIHIQTIGNQD